jgi:cytochrome c peroxidase
MSCATCHAPSQAFAEPRAVSHGIGARARKRNTPSLLNVAIFRTSFDWDGRAGSLEDQLLGVFSPEGDMGIDARAAIARIVRDPLYVTLFVRAFGRSPDERGMRRALADFQRQLLDGPSRFERYYLHGDSTALDARERRGWELFRSGKTGCAGCHVPLPDPDGSGYLVFSDDRFHNLGVGYAAGRFDDVGRFGVTREPSSLGAFRTPGLRNVALTAPYMHDGSLATLEEVVDFYVRGGRANPFLDAVILPRALTTRDRAALVAFLRTLTSEWMADSMEVRRRLLSPAVR